MPHSSDAVRALKSSLGDRKILVRKACKSVRHDSPGKVERRELMDYVATIGLHLACRARKSDPTGDEKFFALRGSRFRQDGIRDVVLIQVDVGNRVPIEAEFRELAPPNVTFIGCQDVFLRLEQMLAFDLQLRLVRVNGAFIKIEQRDVVVVDLVRQDDEFDHIRIGLLPERFFTRLPSVGLEIVVQGL